MRKIFSLIFSTMFLLSVFCLSAFGQTTGAIVGTVTDANGAVVPNATVVIKNVGSGQEFTATTNDGGIYRVPALGSGIYTVTVTANSFKKSVIENVKVDIGTPSTADITLQTGDVSATVVVTSGGEVLQTQTPTVGTTITGRQIIETPITSRDALDLVTLLPGTAQVGRPRASSVNGLPKGSLSITIDGVDVQDNLLKSSDGFFTFVRPRIDAIEEVNVSTAAGGSDTGGEGAVQIKFVTKRGTNEYHGNVFLQHRDQGLNSNYWWNNATGLPRNPIVLNQFGGNIGGPLPFPHFGEGGPKFHNGKDKAFFFLNYEEFRIPESTNRTRQILTQDAINGIYRYGSSSANLLQIAGNAGFTNTLDPTISSLMTAIRATTNQGTLTARANPNQQDFNIISRTKTKRDFTTLRLDFNLHKNHSVENIYNRNIFHAGKGAFDLLNSVDPSFPGFPNSGDQGSQRYSNSTAVRSTLTQNLINEARYAALWGKSVFRSQLSAGQFANQGGYNLNFNFISGAAFGLTNVTAGAPSAVTGFSQGGSSDNRRSSPTRDFTDNLTWLKGNHTMNFGGQYKIVRILSGAINQIVPLVSFGLDSTETTLSNAFNTTTMPGATPAQLGEARQLYALLTGRLTSIQGTAYLNSEGSYKFQGDQFQSGKQTVWGFYGQDSWRIKPNLTINFGVRWQPQDSFETTTANFSAPSSFNDVWGISGVGNLFKPGTLTGKVPTFNVVPEGFKPYKTDYKNFAPSFGVVYSPDFGDSGFLNKMFGKSGDSVFRAGYSRSFVREGTNVALTVYTGNPGATLDASRFVSLGTLPVGSLFRNIASVTTPTFSNTPQSVITGTFNNTTLAIDPNIKTGTVDSWSVGYQRKFGENTVLEARYVANRGKNLWRLYNLNEINITENGFAREFKLAQANLVANRAAGRGDTFAYFGAGTNPLPIFQAYFRGAGDPTQAAQYTSTQYTAAGNIVALDALVPNAVGLAQTVENNLARRTNALAAGLAENFFYVNPTTRGGGSFVVDNSSESSYDSLQLELRRRLSNGLMVQGSYTFSKSLSNAFAASSTTQLSFRSLRNRNLDKTYSPFDVAHAVKVNWIYELPFGKDKELFSGAGRLTNFLVGGWSIIGAAKIQSGTPINFGNVQLIGMTAKDLEKAIGVYYNQTLTYGTNAPIVASASYLPADIIQNSFLAFDRKTFTGRGIAPATYNGCVQEFVGQCGYSQLIVHGPSMLRMDLSLSKKFKFDEKRNVEIRTAFYNALNNTQWRVGGWAADVVTVAGLAAAERLGGTSFGQFRPGTVYQDTSTTNDQGGRTIEFILRINF